MFAKLFERGERQVLVKIDQGDDLKPEVRFFTEPDDFGVCSAAISFKDDSDKSWEDAEKIFDRANEKNSFEFVDSFLSKLDMNVKG